MIGQWRATVNIKPFLTEEETPEAVKMAADKIVNLFNTNLSGRYKDPDLLYILDQLETAGEVGEVEGFNHVLDDLYDWADDRRIWLGLK